MKYNSTAKSFLIFFKHYFKKHYRKHYPEIKLKNILKSLKKEYKEMILRTPGIGGKENYLEPNLVMACFFFSLAKVTFNMTPEIMDKIIENAFNSKLLEAMNASKRMKATIFSDEEQNQRILDSKRSFNSKYEMDWVYDYKKGNNEFYCTYYKCGICTLAKKEHMEKYVPCLCKTDFKNYELMGAKLLRNKTLAAGDDCCDFHVIKK